MEAIKIYANSRSLERVAGTVKGQVGDLMHFAIFLRNPAILDIKEAHVVEYLHLVQDSGLKQNSVSMKANSIGQFFQFWRKRGYPVVDPELLPNVKRVKGFHKTATQEEYEQLLASLPEDSEKIVVIRNRAILMMLNDTLMRCGELVAMNLDQLIPTEEGGEAVIRTEKSRGMRPFRQIFWKANTERALRKWIQYRMRIQKDTLFKDPDALFVGVYSDQQGKRLTNHAIGILMRKMSVRAGLKRTLNAHALRHKGGHDLNEAGANNSTISAILGHARIESSQVYTEMENDERRKAYYKYKS